MESRSRVVVYGNAQFLETLGACLKSVPQLRAEYLHDDDANARKRVREISPDVVVFDTASPNLDFAIPFLLTNSGRMVIGVDRQTGKVMVLSSRQHTALMGSDLANLIQKQILFEPSFVRSITPPTLRRVAPAPG